MLKRSRMALDHGPSASTAADFATPKQQPESAREKDPAAVALGRRGGLVGGKVRAAKLTAEERSESARKAANARWQGGQRTAVAPEVVERAPDDATVQFRAIADAFDGLVYVCSQDYVVEYMNRRLVERTGRDGTGEKCYRALHDLDDVCSWCVNGRVFRDETVRWEILSPKDDRWYSIVDLPIHRHDGRMSKLALIEDVTASKRTESALETAEAFVGVISHELRTPATTILGIASLIEREPDRPNVAELTRDLKEEAERLAWIVDDLIVLARARRGSVRLSAEPMLLCRVVPPIVEVVRRRYAHLAVFDMDIGAQLPAVLADEVALRQVLHNLLANAAKYAGADGTISIGAREVDGAVELSVLDEGPGLGDDPEALFELFYRSPLTSRRASGSGIGLYVARELATAMGGTLDGDTRESGGSVFRLRLPVALDDPANGDPTRPVARAFQT